MKAAATTVAETADAAKLRREMVFHQAAKLMGWRTDRLARELRTAGVPIMGEGKSRTVFVDDLVAFQARREDDGRRAVEQDDLAKDYVQGKADADLDKLLSECRKPGGTC